MKKLVTIKTHALTVSSLAAGVYFAGCMLMCTITCILNVLVLNFHHRKAYAFVMSDWVCSMHHVVLKLAANQR